MGIAISSSWNASGHTDGRRMLFEIKEAGFSEIELSFDLTASMLKDIESVVREGVVKIVSVHNYCPVPEGFIREEALPDCYAMSSPDETERALAVKFTKRSIDTATSLGAKALVLHCGRVQIADKTRELMELARSGRRGSAEFRSLHEQAIRERAASSARYLANTLKSLEEINKHAAEAGLLLGVENRFYYREIPSFEEIGIILNRFKGSNIFYWHDTGHAAVMEFLGLGRQVDFLNCYGAGVIGMHLHDVLNGQDHLVPSRGELDFSQFKPYLKQNTLKVMEAHQPSAAEELAKGREFLERIFRGYA